MKGLGSEVPPQWEHVLIFFDQAGFTESEARQFFQHYESSNWCSPKGTPIKSWKTKAQEWIWNIKMRHPYLRINGNNKLTEGKLKELSNDSERRFCAFSEMYF